MRIASIDIGTNTCNLSIAEYSESNKLEFLYKEKQAISLINTQFKNDIISQDSIQKLTNVLIKYKQTIDDLNTDKIIAVATSGVRNSANKKEVLKSIKDVIGINVIEIDGHTEAKFVYSGVKNAIKIGPEYILIIDIGGGSVEFIICNQNGILSTFSFDVGTSRLLSQHKFSDPLSNNDINNLHNIFNNNLNFLIEKCKELNVETLIGSSGSFETFVDLINGSKEQRADILKTNNNIEIAKFEEIYNKLITYNYEQRSNMSGMEILRVKLIPIAAIITKLLIDKININNLIQSRYSIKEGVIFDYISRL